MQGWALGIDVLWGAKMDTKWRDDGSSGMLASCDVTCDMRVLSTWFIVSYQRIYKFVNLDF